MAEYTILGVAGDDLRKQGELVDKHCANIERRWATYRVQSVALSTEIAELEAKLSARKAQRDDLEAKTQRANAWDEAQLLFWFCEASQHKGMDKKSLVLSRGFVIGSRVQAMLYDLVDVDFFATAFPEHVVRSLQNGEVKKHLAATEDGRLVVKATGEVIPAEAIRITREAGEKYYIKIPGLDGDKPTEHPIVSLSDLPEDTEGAVEEDEDGGVSQSD